MAKKRANGEGNIRKRKDGRWEGRYTAGYDPETGKRIIKNVLGKTQTEAKEKLKQAIENSQTLDISRANEYTVATWLQTWFELYAKPHVRPSTVDYYRHSIELHVAPAIGDIPLRKLTTRDLQRLYKHLLDAGRVETLCAESRRFAVLRAALFTGAILFWKRTAPARPQEKHKGLCPLTPELPSVTRLIRPVHKYFSAFDLVCVSFRSAATAVEFRTQCF